MTLVDLHPEHIATILELTGDLEFQTRLMEMGIFPGIQVRAVRQAPWNGPVEIKVYDCYLFIRRDDARKIILT